jgi:hypothetical protein
MKPAPTSFRRCWWSRRRRSGSPGRSLARLQPGLRDPAAVGIPQAVASGADGAALRF